MVIGDLRCFDSHHAIRESSIFWIDTRDCTSLGPGRTWSILNHRGMIPRFLTPTAYFIGTTLKFVKDRAES
jgi:hypothetical protein